MESLERTVLITGINGFLGRNLAHALMEQDGIAVRGVGRSATTQLAAVPYTQCDLAKTGSSANVFSGVDVVVHTAAILPGATGSRSELNELITRNALAAASECSVRKFIHISSASVYGPSPAARAESDQLEPDSDYGVGKVACEAAVRSAYASGSLESAAIVRMANVFGHGMPISNNLQKLATAIDRRLFVGIGKGTNRKSLLHIDDATETLRLTVAQDDSGLLITNAANGDLTMGEVGETIARALSQPEPRWLGIANPQRISALLQRFPSTRIATVGSTVRTFARDDVLDLTLFRKTFPSAASTSLETRILETFSAE